MEKLRLTVMIVLMVGTQMAFTPHVSERACIRDYSEAVCEQGSKALVKEIVKGYKHWKMEDSL